MSTASKTRTGYRLKISQGDASDLLLVSARSPGIIRSSKRVSLNGLPLVNTYAAMKLERVSRRTGGNVAAPLIPAGFDFTDPDLWAPAASRRGARRTAAYRAGLVEPPEAEHRGFQRRRLLGRQRATRTSRRSPGDSDVFSSREKTAIIRFDDDITARSLELQRLVLLNMDAPQHTKLRRIVSKGFTPRSSKARGRAADARRANRREAAAELVPATSSPRSRASCRCRRSPS